MSQCRATTSIERFEYVMALKLSAGRVGIQCKFSRYHEGDHYGRYTDGSGEHHWPNTTTEASDDWDEILSSLRDLTERDYGVTDGDV